jgi:hypothetical protein
MKSPFNCLKALSVNKLLNQNTKNCFEKRLTALVPLRDAILINTRPTLRHRIEDLLLHQHYRFTSAASILRTVACLVQARPIARPGRIQQPPVIFGHGAI